MLRFRKDDMMRTLIWFIYFGVSLLETLPDLARAKKFDREGKTLERDQLSNKRAKLWARRLVKLTGSRITVTGEENLPLNGAILFVSNHQSNFDIPLLLGFVSPDKGFIAKIEMLNMKIVRTWMRYIQCVFMDRDDIRQAVKAINEGIQVLKNGYNLVLFPEGTRSKTGELTEFKPGGFKLATKSGAAIVPVVIHGSMHMMKKGSIFIQPADVEIEILPPIHVEPGDSKDTIGLSERVKKAIEEALEKKKL